MSKHTPGPWDYDRDDLGIWINSSSYPQPLAKMGTAMLIPHEANARLIAAAPELYEALRAIVDQERQPQDAETRMHDMADLARAALAKVDA